MEETMKNIALIIAGGVGARMGQDIPKQFINVYDKPVIVYTMEAFQQHPQIDVIEIVCLDEWQGALKAYAKQFGIAKLENVVSGGKNGQDSIRNGLYDIYSRHNDRHTRYGRCDSFHGTNESILNLICQIVAHAYKEYFQNILDYSIESGLL